MLNFLEQALSLDPNYRLLVDHEPDFDSLRTDPEFQAICEGSVGQGIAPTAALRDAFHFARQNFEYDLYRAFDVRDTISMLKVRKEDFVSSTFHLRSSIALIGLHARPSITRANTAKHRLVICLVRLGVGEDCLRRISRREAGSVNENSVRRSRHVLIASC